MGLAQPRGGWAGLKLWVVDGSRSPRIRGEALVDLEIPPAMGCIKAQADGIAVRRLPFRTLVSSGSKKKGRPRVSAHPNPFDAADDPQRPPRDGREELRFRSGEIARP